MIELTGKALGIAVAGEVMGWTEVVGDDPVRPADGPYPRFYISHLGDKFVIWVLDTFASDGRWWWPWGDMNDCMEVVEKLRDDGWRFCLSDFKSIYGEQWEAWFHKGTYGVRVEVMAEVLCEAILRAALKAVRVDDSKYVKGAGDEQGG